MVDYEQPVLDALNSDYAAQVADFFDRGSAIMMGATHSARQILWAETCAPVGFARAVHALGIPQYWAWRLCGVPASEVSHLGAQSHLWNVPEQRWSAIVKRRGWEHLMPPIAPAWADLGPVRADLATRHGLPKGLRIHTGVHDSSANLYRYQAAGLSEFVLVSTGTWIVAMADNVPLDRIDPARGMTLNADVHGAPIAGALCMGGREFVGVAGDQPEGTRADAAAVADLIQRGTLALPGFAPDDGQFPGSGGQGRIVGREPRSATERLALAVIHAALLTTACADAVAPGRTLILDGAFVRDPCYGALVAALRPGLKTLVNDEGYGVAAGSALLCGHGRHVPVRLDLTTCEGASNWPGLDGYAAKWHELSLTSC